MFDLSEHSIRMQTRKGNDIDNGQSKIISSFESSQFREFQSRYERNVQFRSKPTGYYNCHGLTFACRRTGVYEAVEVQKILRDDAYVEINVDNVLPGDVIVYFIDNGEIWHSGVVVEAPNELKIPLVVSKWGKYKEAIHWANNCPYDFSQVKYYRIKE